MWEGRARVRAEQRRQSRKGRNGCGNSTVWIRATGVDVNATGVAGLGSS